MIFREIPFFPSKPGCLNGLQKDHLLRVHYSPIPIRISLTSSIVSDLNTFNFSNIPLSSIWVRFHYIRELSCILYLKRVAFHQFSE